MEEQIKEAISNLEQEVTDIKAKVEKQEEVLEKLKRLKEEIK